MAGRGGVAAEGGQEAQKESEFTFKDMVGKLQPNCVPSPCSSTPSKHLFERNLQSSIFLKQTSEPLLTFGKQNIYILKF